MSCIFVRDGGRYRYLPEVVVAMKRHWSAGTRHPQLKHLICDEFPGISVVSFNKAADLAWALEGIGQ